MGEESQIVVKNALAFALAAVSAYAISFASDMFFGWAFKVYPREVFRVIPAWIITSAVTGILAVRIVRRARFVVIPYAVITLLAVFGGIVGHRYNFAVAGFMLYMTVCIWGLTQPPPLNFYDVWAFIESLKNNHDKDEPR